MDILQTNIVFKIYLAIPAVDTLNSDLVLCTQACTFFICPALEKVRIKFINVEQYHSYIELARARGEIEVRRSLCLFYLRALTMWSCVQYAKIKS